MIDLDYSHKPLHECKAIWKKIIQDMLLEGFYVDNDVFLITTDLDKDKVCDKARQALKRLDDYLEIHHQHLFQYITDFFIIDMSDYVDLRFPTPDIGVL